MKNIIINIIIYNINYNILIIYYNICTYI